MTAPPAQRWAFTQPSPLGPVRSSYELTAEGLNFRCDGPLGPAAERLRWDAMVEAATATMDLPAGKGGPDLPGWVPGRLEWLLVRRSGANAHGFMRPLPAGGERDAIVAGLRARLGRRWVGEGLGLAAAQQRFGVSERGGTLKVAALVLSVLALLFALLLVVVFASALLLLPAGMLIGAWCCRRALDGLRTARQAAAMPVTKVARAAAGLVKLEGRAVTGQPSPAAVSGRPCVWWDVAVDAWYDSRDDGGWQQVMARHGGQAGLLVLEDETGRLPVWLRDADLLLQAHTWENERDALPAGGIALLEGTAFAWNGGQRLRVRETRMEADGPVCVLGTLGLADELPVDGDGRGVARLRHALRTGRWRPALLHALPAALRAPVAVTIGLLDLLFGIGRGGERPVKPEDAPPPPALAPAARLVWKGRTRHPLLVCDRHESAALEQLRKRSHWALAIGAVLFVYCLSELVFG